MKIVPLAAALPLILTLGGYAQTLAPAPAQDKLVTYVNHLMDFHIGVERTVPPGWSITVQPVTMDQAAQGTVDAQVHIFIKGAPPGTVFEQQVVSVGDDQPASVMQGITVGKDGLLVCAGRTPEQCGDPKKPDDPIEFTLQGSLKGEPYRFLFASDAGTIGTVFVVNPVGDRKPGCTLSAVRLTPYFELALITGVGFPPNSDVHYTATPGSTQDSVVRSNALGVVRFSLIPHTDPGQKSGKLKVKIMEKQCPAEVSYDWGKS